MWGFGLSKGFRFGAFRWHSEARYCTVFLLCVFSPWSLPRVGNGDSKRKVVTPGHRVDAGSNTGKSVRLTRKTCPSLMVHDIPDPGHPTRRRW